MGRTKVSLTEGFEFEAAEEDSCHAFICCSYSEEHVKNSSRTWGRATDKAPNESLQWSLRENRKWGLMSIFCLGSSSLRVPQERREFSAPPTHSNFSESSLVVVFFFFFLRSEVEIVLCGILIRCIGTALTGLYVKDTNNYLLCKVSVVSLCRLVHASSSLSSLRHDMIWALWAVSDSAFFLHLFQL